jgi:hypothetical protein
MIDLKYDHYSHPKDDAITNLIVVIISYEYLYEYSNIISQIYTVLFFNHSTIRLRKVVKHSLFKNDIIIIFYNLLSSMRYPDIRKI